MTKSLTIQQKQKTWQKCKPYLEQKDDILHVEAHIAFVESGLKGLSGKFQTLDASKPWFIYWMLNSLALMRAPLSEWKSKAIATLRHLQHPLGGWSGGYMQEPHIATTYAAVLSLALLDDTQGYDIINRGALASWLLSLKQANGGFRVSRGGEIDVRAAYCVLVVGSLTNTLTPELTENTAKWLSQCQTFEGGIAPSPGNEAHGGYAFCVLSALWILGGPQNISAHLNLETLLEWTTRQQMAEGGFSGRTNKLVDGCYSWWVGGSWLLLEAALAHTNNVPCDFMNKDGLRKYILLCCQDLDSGGLRDKPGTFPDFYHTCYCLAGLALTQYSYSYTDKNGWKIQPLSVSADVSAIDPVYAVPIGLASRIKTYFED